PPHTRPAPPVQLLPRAHASIGSSAAPSSRPVTMLLTRRTLPCQGAAASREPGPALALRLQGQLTRDALVSRVDGDLHRREQRAPGLHPPDDAGRLRRPVLGDGDAHAPDGRAERHPLVEEAVGLVEELLPLLRGDGAADLLARIGADLHAQVLRAWVE